MVITAMFGVGPSGNNLKDFNGHQVLLRFQSGSTKV